MFRSHVASACLVLLGFALGWLYGTASHTPPGPTHVQATARVPPQPLLEQSGDRREALELPPQPLEQSGAREKPSEPPPQKSYQAEPRRDDQLAAALALHGHWQWDTLIKDLLLPFPRITPGMLDAGIKTCFENGTMYCLRAQVVGGKLYITDYRAIFFDRYYAPSRVMPLLETLRRHPKLPDVDLVVAAVDEPRVKTMVHEREWTRLCTRYPGVTAATPQGAYPPPLFSSTVNRAHLDLPWLDFSFFMPRVDHKLRTPPWATLQPQMLEQSSHVRWEDKIELAMHTGNVGSPFRKRLSEVAAKNPKTMLVNELFIGDHGKIKQTCAELGKDRQGGFQQHLCYMTFVQQCSYKYLLNSASIGYANKFKYLLLCGSTVIYVQDGMTHKEFYEYGLLPGVHYVTVPTAADVPAMVEALKKNDSYARAVAEAGRARLAALDVAAITDFMAELLTGYSQRQAFRVTPGKGAARIDCEDDLWRHYARDANFLRHYHVEDNSTCVHPIDPSTKLGPPGWGGAYAGSKVRCEASHDLRHFAQPDACKQYAGWLGGTSFAKWDEFPWTHAQDRSRSGGVASAVV